MFARDLARKAPDAGWSVPAVRSRMPASGPERWRGPAFDFGDVSVTSPTRTRSSSKSSCNCPKSRNPQGSSSGDEVQTRVATSDTDVATKDTDEESTGAAKGGGAPARPRAQARLKSGPRYTPNGNLTPTNSGGRKRVDFDFDAVFDSDPANGVYPSCGEIHQDIKWNRAAATNMTSIVGNPVPHSGFPAAHPPMVWIEDRDTANTRYGRRSGPMSAPTTGDEYTTAGVRDMARGATYHGHDGPNGPSSLAGRWYFMVLAFDMCNHGVQVGNADFITIDW
jgi:hypothetical protein